MEQGAGTQGGLRRNVHGTQRVLSTCADSWVFRRMAEA